MLDRLLWEGRNKWQMGGAFFGAFTGLFLLLLPVQLYLDIQSVLNGSNTDEEYVMINKPVSLLSTIGLKSSFTEDEIKELEAQPFVNKAGKFTPNQFKVSASSSMIGFYTELFFEAVPDDFLDFRPAEWNWKEGDKQVPIIMSRDYLALYNFGFAPSQGLPQFTAGTIGKFKFDLKLRGKGQFDDFRGKIVGFSDRINSILVPQEFMDWANGEFGSSEKPSSRLIIDTDQPYSEELANFLKKKGYEVSRGKLIGGQIGALLNGILSVIAGIGVLVFMLSILIFVLSFRLVIAESRQRIDLLLQLGYTPKSLIDTLGKRLVKMIVGIGVVALLVLIPLKYLISRAFSSQGFEVGAGLHWSVYVAAVVICGLFYFINRVTIQRNMVG